MRLQLIGCIALFLLANNMRANKLGTSTRYFVPNNGQVVDQWAKPNGNVLFLLPGSRFNVQLRPAGFSYDFFEAEMETVPTDPFTQGLPPSGKITLHRIDFDLVGSNTNVIPEPTLPGGHRINYYTAGTPQGGVVGVIPYSRVLYRDVYPGVDLEFVLDENASFKYNFIVHPGARLEHIRLDIRGAEQIELGAEGLVIGTRFGKFAERVPQCTWQGKGGSGTMEGRWVKQQDGLFAFAVDRALIPEGSELVIDPVPELLWCSLYGGVHQSILDVQMAMDLSTNDRAFGGYVQSTGALASAGAYQSTFGGGVLDIFIGEFNGQDNLAWCTYFGSTGDELAHDIAMDGTSVYCVGASTANALTLVTDTLHPYAGGQYDALVAKFDGTDGSLEAARYFGGSGSDWMRGIELHNNSIVVIGSTTSTSGIATPGTHDTQLNGSNQDCFVAKFSLNLVRTWGTYYGGSESEVGFDVAVDGSGYIYAYGVTGSASGIATPGRERSSFVPANQPESFIVKLGSTGQRIWGSYYGGSGPKSLYDLELEGIDIYLFGYVVSPQPISQGAFQAVHGGLTDAYLMKIDSASFVQWATYYGGNNGENFDDIDVQGAGIYCVGLTGDADMNTPDALDSTGAGSNCWLVKFDTSGVMQWSTIWGGPEDNMATRVIMDGDTMNVVGATQDNELATPGAYQTDTIGAGSLFLARLLDCQGPVPVSTAPIVGSNVVCPGVSGTYVTAIVPDALEYDWSVSPGGTLLSGNGDTAVVVQFNSLPVEIRVRARNACGTAPDQLIVVNADTAFQMSVTPAGPVQLCFGDEVVLYASPAVTYLWGNGSTVDSMLVSLTGNYYVTGTNAMGCTDTSPFVQVQFNPNPTPNVGGNTAPDENTLEDYDTFGPMGNDYLWSVSNGLLQSPQGTNDMQVFWLLPGQGWLAVLETQQNCSRSDTLFVNVLPAGGIVVNAEAQIDISPSPARNEVRLSAGSRALGAVTIHDQAARIVLSLQTRETSADLDISHLANGVYEVKALGEGQVLEGRLVVQR